MPDIPQDKFLTVNNLRLHYLDWGGEGKEIMLLLHGFSSCAHAWDSFSAAMREYYHVLALDQRGHGESEWAKDAAYSVKDHVADIAGFVDALGIDRFTLMGHSMGGINATEYAASYTHRVSHLIIIDIGPQFDPRGTAKIMQRMATIPEEFDSLEEVVEYLRQDDPYPEEELLLYQAGYITKPSPGGKLTWKYDKAMREMMRAQKKSQQELLRKWADPFWWSILPRIGCPTLIVRGMESDILSPETARKMQQLLPQSQLAEIEGAGHVVPWDNPAQFESSIRRFLGI